MNNHTLTPLVEGAMLSALTVILGLMAVYLPVLGIVAAFFWMVPIVVLVVRHGLKQGIMALVVVGMLLAVFITPVLSLRMMVSFSLVGLALGYGFRRGWAAARTFVASFAASVVGKALLFGLLLMMQVNPMDMQLDSFGEAFDSTFQLYEQLGMDQEAIQEAKANVDASLKLVGMLTPFIFLLMALLDAAVTYWLSGRVLRRLGHGVQTLPPFKEWRLPVFFPYILGFAMIGIYWGGTREMAWLYELSLNLNMMAMMAGIIQGLALFICVADHYHLSRVWRILLIAFLLTNGLFAQILAFTGLLDMIFDYRRRFGGMNLK